MKTPKVLLVCRRVTRPLDAGSLRSTCRSTYRRARAPAALPNCRARCRSEDLQRYDVVLPAARC